MSASLFTALRRRMGGVLAALCALVILAAQSPAAAQGLIRDAEIEDTLRAYTDPLLVAAGLDPDDVSVYIVDDPSINAFVVGGQNIFVHTGLILAADSPNEIIVHPAAEPVLSEERHAEAVAVMIETPPSRLEEDSAALTYEPDQERRDKFFSRISKWAKKS